MKMNFTEYNPGCALKPEFRNRYLTSSLGKMIPSDPLNLFLIAHNSFVATSLFLDSALLVTFSTKEACLVV